MQSTRFRWGEPDRDLEALTAHLRNSAVRPNEALASENPAMSAAARRALRELIEVNGEILACLGMLTAYVRSLDAGRVEMVEGAGAERQASTSDPDLPMRSAEPEPRAYERVEPRGKGETLDATDSRDSEDGFDYLRFEHQFRGSTTEIKRRQAAYVQYFTGRQRVLDIGSGRGEFLELLAERAVMAEGVDVNERMVEQARARGLLVVQANVFDYLPGLPDGSLDGVFSAQFVEHLPPHQILTLIQLCGRKLRPGAVMIVETVNPHSPNAFNNFYLDPTHVRPVPPELLHFMFDLAPFRVARLQFSSPLPGSGLEPVRTVAVQAAATAGPDRVAYWYGEHAQYLDYAIIAYRR